MSKEAFEHSFLEVVSHSFSSQRAPEDLKKRLTERLSAEDRLPLPEGVDEQVASSFQDRLSMALHRCCDQSPDGSVALRVEAEITSLTGRDSFSERSIWALVQGSQVPTDAGIPREKLRFVSGLREAVRRSVVEQRASESVRLRIEEALKSQDRTTAKTVEIASKKQWRRGLSALTTLAAGFALIFLTLFGSTDVALANTVRRDHKNCCPGALKSGGNACRPLSVLESRFGSLPKPRINASWKLILSQVCQDEGGRPMIHMLYSQPGPDDRARTLSLHFIPLQEGSDEKLRLKENQPVRISDEGFPVLGWREGSWICTACSPDLELQELRAEL